MASFGSQIKEKRLKKGWSQAELARRAGITQPSVSRIEDGTQTNLTTETKHNLLAVLDLEPIPTPAHHDKPIPVISWVHAGLFANPVDVWPAGVSGIDDPVTSFASTSDNAFALVVEGDSMMPRYFPGDIVIVDPAIRCDNGSACVVWINGEVSLKLFWERGEDVLLKPMNDKYPEMVIKKDSKVDFKIIGKVVDMKVKL